jgi:hypothetical protein
MLGLRMLHLNYDRRLTTPNALDPIVVTKNPQRLGDGLIKVACRHLDGGFNPAKIDAGNSACLQSHISQLSYSLFIRYQGAVQGHIFQSPLLIFSLLFYQERMSCRQAIGGLQTFIHHGGPSPCKTNPIKKISMFKTMAGEEHETGAG